MSDRSRRFPPPWTLDEANDEALAALPEGFGGVWLSI